MKLDLDEIDNILEEELDSVKHTSALAITFNHLDNSKFDSSRRFDDEDNKEEEHDHTSKNNS